METVQAWPGPSLFFSRFLSLWLIECRCIINWLIRLKLAIEIVRFGKKRKGKFEIN